MNYSRLDVPLFCDSQNPKDCKKRTPDFLLANKKTETPQVGFEVKDIVSLTDVVSLVNKKVLNGEFKFDSYDKYDNTCYISSWVGGKTWNVLLSDITFISKKNV